MCSAAAAVCPPVVGVAAGVFGVGVALGATAAVCPPVGIAAIFVAGVALGAAFRVKQATHHAVDDTDLYALHAVASAAAASEAATGCLRVVKSAACSAFEGAKRFAIARWACQCHGTGKNNKDEEAPAAKRDELDVDVDGEMDHHRAAHQLVVSEAALFDVACSSGPGGGTAPAPWDSAVVFPANASGALPALVDASASELLAARAAWRASEVMAVLETLKPLEEKLGANIPREAKSCICVMAAAAGVCLDVFKPPTGGSVGGSSGLRTRGGAVAEPRFRGHGTSNRRAVQ
jgi:hypothetical protein